MCNQLRAVCAGALSAFSAVASAHFPLVCTSPTNLDKPAKLPFKLISWGKVLGQDAVNRIHARDF